MSDPIIETAANQEALNDATIAPESEIVELLKSEVKKAQEIAARAQADYLNFQRRTESEKADMNWFLTAKVIRNILPTVDNLDRAIANIPSEIASHEWTKGILALREGLVKQLETLGAKPFVSLEMPADASYHEVLAQGPGQSGIITSEFEKGWMLGEKVLRHAKVISGNGEMSAELQDIDT